MMPSVLFNRFYHGKVTSSPPVSLPRSSVRLLPVYIAGNLRPLLSLEHTRVFCKDQEVAHPLGHACC